MKTHHKIIAALALLLTPVIPGVVNAANITFTTDNADMLIGTFSVTGAISGYSRSPINFDQLPGTSNQSLFINRFPDILILFSSSDEGLPGWPRLPIQFNGITTTVTGTYNNAPGGLPVAFVISGIDTGGFEGEFSGDFSFHVQRESVPEGGATLLLLGISVVGLASFRRRLCGIAAA